MKTRSVSQVLSPRTLHMVGDGFRVHNFIPSYPALSMERMNPFIMLDYGSRFYFPPSNKPRGVDVHPHRGFETVTIVYKGKVAHHDSAGNSGVIGEGDVQWMTAASGVLHKEYHEAQFSKSGGDFQMVQLWVNLPSRVKMSKPKYQEITRNNMGRYQLPDNAGTVEVIAGNYQDVKGPASTFTPIHLMNARLETGGQASFTFPANYRTAILAIEGSVVIHQKTHLPVNHMALLENDGETFSIKANEPSVVLIMSAEPLNEPIAAHGPFVMNTRQEIMQAFADYQAGKFGRLN